MRSSLTIPSTLNSVGRSRTHTLVKRRVGHEVPGVVAALFSKVAGSKYTSERLRVYEASKICEPPLVKR